MHQKQPQPAYSFNGFIITPLDVQSHSVELNVEEVGGYAEDPVTGKYTLPINLTQYLRCSIKWDSCAHFYFDGYLHICGVSGFVAQVALLRHLYDKAFELMGKQPLGGEEWPLSDAEWELQLRKYE